MISWNIAVRINGVKMEIKLAFVHCTHRSVQNRIMNFAHRTVMLKMFVSNKAFPVWKIGNFQVWIRILVRHCSIKEIVFILICRESLFTLSCWRWNRTWNQRWFYVWSRCTRINNVFDTCWNLFSISNRSNKSQRVNRSKWKQTSFSFRHYGWFES